MEVIQAKNNAQNGRILPKIKLKRVGIRFILQDDERKMMAEMINSNSNIAYIIFFI